MGFKPPATGIPAIQNSDGTVGNFTPIWRQWFIDLSTESVNVTGLTVTVPLAKLTTFGAQGSMEFTDGILTGYTAPT